MVASQVLELDRKLILRMLNEYPQVAVTWQRAMSERLLATVNDLGRVRAALKEIKRSRRAGGRPPGQPKRAITGTWSDGRGQPARGAGSRCR